MAAEEAWDGWEWLEEWLPNPAEELARSDIRPYGHPTRVAERAAEKARRAEALMEDDYGELARECMYEREGYQVGLRAARIFGECDDFDRWRFRGCFEGGGVLGRAISLT